MTMTRKINKLEKPGGPQGNFHALFGRSPAFYGHFRADVMTSKWYTCISSSPCPSTFHHYKFLKTKSKLVAVIDANVKLDQDTSHLLVISSFTEKMRCC